MSLNIPTLVLVDIYILTLLGILMFHAWRRGRREATLGYMTSMLLLGTLAIVLSSLRGRGIDYVPIIIGNLLLLLACAMNWTAMRVFAGRRAHVPGIVAGGGIWLLLCAVPAFYESLAARVMLSTLLIAAYTALAASELWRSRESLNVSIKPALALMLLHTAFYAWRVVFDRGEALQNVLDGKGSDFFALLVFETLLYAIGIAFVTLAMVKERAELQYKSAAFSDPLTGIGNRRALIASGEQLLYRCRALEQPVSLLVCDLDFFKRLNDSFGHATGDEVLVDFSRIIAASMRKQDVFGRLGGEEFACVLENADAPTAVRVAERIRQAFAELPFQQPDSLSVSIGVATIRSEDADLLGLMSRADKALYVAKAKGRNRVELAA
ncbi:diguanylate cyclase [Pseudomonas sp. Marseille-Q8238]